MNSERCAAYFIEHRDTEAQSFNFREDKVHGEKH